VLDAHGAVNFMRRNRRGVVPMAVVSRTVIVLNPPDGEDGSSRALAFESDPGVRSPPDSAV